jgi:hypothetical protein
VQQFAILLHFKLWWRRLRRRLRSGISHRVACSLCYLLHMLFDTEDGSSTFLRNANKLDLCLSLLFFSLFLLVPWLTFRLRACSSETSVNLFQRSTFALFVTSCMLSLLFHPEDRGSIFLRNNNKLHFSFCLRLASYWIFWITLWFRRWRQYVPPKRRYTSIIAVLIAFLIYSSTLNMKVAHQ